MVTEKKIFMTAKNKSIAHAFPEWKRLADFAFIKEKTE
jgi:hypothetical protein